MPVAGRKPDEIEKGVRWSEAKGTEYFERPLDPDRPDFYVDEVVRRWQRRRYGWQKQERALAELRAALEPPLARGLKAFNDVFAWVLNRANR